MTHRSHRFFLFFLVLAGGWRALSAKPVDLIRGEVYFRTGFDSSWSKELPETLQDSREWLKLQPSDLPWNMASQKLATFAKKQIPDLPERHFLQWKNYEKRDFSFLFLIPSEKINFDTAVKPAAIFLASVGHGWEVYLNGHLVKKRGMGGDRTSGYVRDMLVPANSTLLKKNGTNLLLIHVQGDPTHLRTGFFRVAPYFIGPLEELSPLRNEMIPYILIFLYFFVGLYHMLLFIRRRSETYNLYFSVFCALLTIYLITRSATVFDYVSDYDWLARVELSSLFTAIVTIAYFFDLLLVEKVSPVVRWYSRFAIPLAIIILFAPLGIQEDILRIWQASAPIFLIYAIYRISKAVREAFQRNRGEYSRVKAAMATLVWSVPGNIVVGLLIIVGTATFDILDSVFWHTGVALTKYGFFAFVMGIAISLANRFLTVHNQVEELNRTLEEKVEERTRELKETLDRVNALKTKQDGDYYLTSLLIRPLSHVDIESETVHIDSFVRQKTHFQFRKWQTEIGGDINIASEITLRGEKYVVFSNADAMGKSIQGAGGALVFGVVFNAILKRTQTVKSMQEVTPERWLKNCFLELQKMFVSFDGSMLISAVVGLLHEESGALYYFNAEHPFPILLRDGKASFLHDEMTLRKIGIMDIESMFQVLTFLMRDEDVLILGSDGRDDLLVDSPDEGRVMNEDETKILKVVESARGELSSCYEILAQEGEITDDLSLLRISFTNAGRKAVQFPEDSAEVKTEIKELIEKGGKADLEPLLQSFRERTYPPDVQALMIRLCLKNGRPQEALQIAENAASKFPMETGLLYLAGLAAKAAGQMEKAIDYAETVRLRAPAHLNNLLNLVDAYRKGGFKSRAIEVLREIPESAQDNAKVSQLKKLLTE